MIEIRRGDELGESSRRRITEVLVRGFAEDFAYFSKDPRVLTDAFAHMLVLERFYVAVVDGEPAAVASVTEGEQECFAPRGAPSGTRWVVSTARSATGSSGASSSAQTTVRGTASRRSGSSRRRRSTRAGVGTALMRHLMELPYDELVLRDIKDTNAPRWGSTASSGSRRRGAARCGSPGGQGSRRTSR